MTIAWTSTRDALTSALAGASNVDRAAIIAARDALNSLGARYDAAVSSGALSPVSGSTAFAVAEARRAAALADLARAVARLEAVPSVRARLQREDDRTRRDTPERARRALRLAAQPDMRSDPDAAFRSQRVTAHLAALESLARTPATREEATERELAAALDNAARLLAYLGTP